MIGFFVHPVWFYQRVLSFYFSYHLSLPQKNPEWNPRSLSKLEGPDIEWQNRENLSQDNRVFCSKWIIQVSRLLLEICKIVIYQFECSINQWRITKGYNRLQTEKKVISPHEMVCSENYPKINTVGRDELLLFFYNMWKLNVYVLVIPLVSDKVVLLAKSYSRVIVSG